MQMLKHFTAGDAAGAAIAIVDAGVGFGEDGERDGFGRVAAEVKAGWCVQQSIQLQ